MLLIFSKGFINCRSMHLFFKNLCGPAQSSASYALQCDSEREIVQLPKTSYCVAKPEELLRISPQMEFLQFFFFLKLFHWSICPQYRMAMLMGKRSSWDVES